MKYIRYTAVDYITRIPVTKAPARNGPDHPAISGLQFRFALESQYPTNVPMFYGTCDDDADTDIPGVLGVLTAEEHASAEVAEMEARDAAAARVVRMQRDALIAATDYLLMPDYPIGAEGLAAVRAYRQALRDVPLQAGFPQAIDWPMSPIITE
ncbi:tail fiber assembly protein [Microvirgula aerodenitrificans]|nr:tail fiber assembly protein [Microvirgula aerodenitrificans]